MAILDNADKKATKYYFEIMFNRLYVIWNRMDLISTNICRVWKTRKRHLKVR